MQIFTKGLSVFGINLPEIHPTATKAKKTPDYVYPYQFKNAFTISDEMINSLHELCNTFAKNLTENLPSTLNSDLSVIVDKIEKMSVRQYLMSLNTATFISTIDAMQILSTIALEVNPIIVYGIINKMLGGDGDVPIFAPKLQSLEMAFVRKFFNQILIELSLVWKPLYSITFVINEIYSTPSSVEELKLYDTMLVTTFKLTLGSSEGLMTIALPSKVFGPLLAETGFHIKNSTSKSVKNISLDNIEIPLSTSFGHVDLTQADLVSLRQGDIIPIDFDASPVAIVKIAEEEMFSALPGLVGNKKGIALQKHISQFKDNPWMT